MKIAKLTTLLVLVLCSILPAQDTEDSISIMHWWTSDSERQAAQLIIDSLANQGLPAEHYFIPGGAGEGATRVLKARILAGQQPDIAQIVGPSIDYWAGLNFLHPLGSAPERQAWSMSIHPQAWQLVRHQGQAFAVPLSIHRINQLWWHAEYAPQMQVELDNWPEFIAHLQHLADRHQRPALVHANQPWQNATLFEVVLAGTVSPEDYWKIMVWHDRQAIEGPGMALALERLRELRSGLLLLNNQEWQNGVQAIKDGKALGMIMGDWALAEAQLQSLAIHCQALPSRVHLYSIDSLAFPLAGKLNNHQVAALSQTWLSPDWQRSFSQAKGSIPARLDVPVEGHSCLQQSQLDFQQQLTLPSLVHRATGSEEARNVFIHAIDRFFNDDQAQITATQQRLSAELGALK